ALTIDEQSYGPNHPDVARDLINLAELLRVTNRLAEGEPLCRRALAISEQSYGPNHPDVAIGLNNLPLLLRDTNRPAEAGPLCRRALRILVLSTLHRGHDDPNLEPVRRNYTACLKQQGRAESQITAELRALDAEAQAQAEQRHAEGSER